MGDPYLARGAAQQVKRYRLLSAEWGPETGELTPSLKLRWRVIRDKYGVFIEALYGDG
jgi:long-chain acyl-CoA synthetase